MNSKESNKNCPKALPKKPSRMPSIENPFKLDFNELNKFKEQLHRSENFHQKRDFRIFRRKLATRELKTTGIERLNQELRDEAFNFPQFFDTEVWEKEEKEDEILPLKYEPDFPDHLEQICKDAFYETRENPDKRCHLTRTLDKPYNKYLEEKHYQSKVERMKERLAAKPETLEAPEKQESDIEIKTQDSKDQMVELLDEQAKFPPKYKAYSYPSNEVELKAFLKKLQEKSLSETKQDVPLLDYQDEKLLELLKSNEFGIDAGTRVGNKVLLRSFHDRLYNEPRGRFNTYNRTDGLLQTCLTHDDWLKSIVNDPLFLREPPRNRLSPTRKTEDLNDPNLVIFPDKKIEMKPIKESPIKQYIEGINKSLEVRKGKKKTRKLSGMKKDRESGLELTKILDNKPKPLPHPEEIKIFPKIPETPTSSEESLTDSSPITTPVVQKTIEELTLPSYESELEVTRKKMQETREMRERDLVLTSKPDIKVKIFDTGYGLPHWDLDLDIRTRFFKILSDKLTIKESNEDEQEESEQVSLVSKSTISSDCTNFTNDSGSFVKTFEKVRINEIKTKVDKRIEDMVKVLPEPAPTPHTQPFYCVAHAGQLSTMKKLSKPKDKFYTNFTRSAAGMRDRLKVEVDLKKEPVGCHTPRFMTDYDKRYFKEIATEKTQSEFHVKPSQERTRVRNALRTKFATHYIRESIEDTFHIEQKEKKAMDHVQYTMDSYDHFLDEYQETNFLTSINLLRMLNEEYERTTKVRKEHERLRNQIEPMNMRIFKLSTKFVELSIYQNFQFLMMPMDWRREHDFLHRKEDGEFESLGESLAHRSTANLWDPNKDDVWTIKEFYENEFLVRKQKQVVVFPDADSFVKMFKNIRNATSKAIVHYLRFLVELTNLQLESGESDTMLNKYLTTNRSIVNNLNVKKQVMEKLAEKVKKLAINMMDAPLKESTSTNLLRRLEAMCDLLFKEKVLKQIDADTADITVMEKYMAIEKKCLQLLDELDKFPDEVQKEVESRVRTLRMKKMRIAEKAYDIEVNLKMTMEQFKRCLAKPPEKKKREGRLPISIIPKKPKRSSIKDNSLSELEALYVKAFTELDPENVTSSSELMQQIRTEMAEFYEGILEDSENLDKFETLIPEINSFLKLWN